MYKIIFIVIFIKLLLSLSHCQNLKDLTGSDKTNPIAEYDLRWDMPPYNITLYKDPQFKTVQYVIYYTCRYYNDSKNNLLAECKTHANLNDSKNIWGSEIKSCVNNYDYKTRIGVDECGYQSESLYEALFYPYKVQFVNLPPTRGGQVKMSGYFLRVGNMDIKKMWLKFDPINNWPYRALDVDGDYFDENYDPNNLSINFVRGYGIQTLCFDKMYRKCINVTYQSPSINSTFYNHTNQQITITGNNFYNESKVIMATIGGFNISKSDIILADFEKIIINYPSNQSQVLNIKLYIDVLSTFSSIIIEPVPSSSECNVTKYNDGIVQIMGSHLASPIDKSNIIVTINNNNCTVTYNNNSIIYCKLSKDGADNNKHQLSVCINGICNANKVLFEYGKPKIYEINQIGQIFTIYGQNLGSYINKSTNLLLKYNYNNTLIVSPQSISLNETVSTFNIPFFCGNATFQINVTGILSNELQLKPTPLFEVIQSPSTDSKDSLNILLSYYECKYYINTNPIITSTKVQGKRIDNMFSFNVSQGTGTKSEYLLFADQDLKFEYSYAKPVISNHSMNIGLNSENQLTITGINFGTNSSLCNISYNGKNEKCQVDNHYQIKFKVQKLEISANVIVTIDGMESNNYTLELVNCYLDNDIKYPTTYGCSNPKPSILYICKGLRTFIGKSNNTQLLHATYNDKEIDINIKDDNITIPIPEDSNSSLLKLYLNGLFSESYQIKRNNGLIYSSNIKYNEEINLINLNIQGINFGEPYYIQMPTLSNASIGSDNCSILYHGTINNKDCSRDIINCQVFLPVDFNKTILINDQHNNKTLSIPYSILIGNSSIIKSTITDIERTQNQENIDSNKIALAIALPIGLVILIGASVFCAYKYHKNKIDSSKKKNIEIGS